MLAIYVRHLGPDSFITTCCGVLCQTMVKTLLTGATGTLGQALRPRLNEAGHEVRGASRSPPGTDDVEWVKVDLTDGTGIREAVQGVDTVVHAASNAIWRTEATDVRGTERLLEAAEASSVSNFCYVSIVGIDDIPYSYYQAKLAAEQAVEASNVPWTILRATQFHPFVAQLLGAVSRLPIWPLPTEFRIQPVDVGEVADVLVEHATPEPARRVSHVGGPEVRTLGDLARAYRDGRGLRRRIVRFPVPGGMAAAFRGGEATCPDRAVGSRTWEEWLAEQYG